MQVLPGKFELLESAESKGLRAEDDEWEPEWINGLFQVQLVCSELSCQTLYLAFGRYRLDQVPRGRTSGPDYQELLTLLGSEPAFPITDRLPGNTPDLVHERINEAAAIIWRDPNAAGNRLRLAVEELLTYLGIPESQIVNGKEKYLTTHGRIELFKSVDAEAAELLRAVKWVGNDGSHGVVLKPEDVVVQVQILHEALKLIFNQTRQNILNKATLINSNKGTQKK